MKFVVAPDSFKGSITAIEAANAMTEGILRVFPDANIVKVPLADGGEGTVEAYLTAAGGKLVSIKAMDPLGRPIDSFLGILKDGTTAIIEMAAASGLPLLKEEEKDPFVANTYGTGQLIKAALDAGCKKIIIGIGGSATNDGGTGMAEALGVRFFDGNGNLLPANPKGLLDLAKIDISGLDSRLGGVSVIAACDVDNPLYGEHGASAVYGPQKGATPEMIKELDKAMSNLAAVIKQQLGINVAKIPGSGAAGGMGAGIIAFLNGALKPGIELILSASEFEDKLSGATMVLTGEGRVDGQTAFGKAPAGVARIAKSMGIPVFAFGGILGDDYYRLYNNGFSFIGANVQQLLCLDEAISKGYPLLVENVERALRAVRVGMKICGA